jgi:hypothetical protein
MKKYPESGNAGRSSVYYIVYRETHVHNYRGKRKLRTQNRVKRVAIPGRLQSWSRGAFVTRFGSRVHGIKFTYINPIPKGTGRNGRIRKMRITKVIEVPANALNVRVTRRRPKL